MLPPQSTFSKAIHAIAILVAVGAVALIGLGIVLLVVLKQGRGFGS